MRKILKPTLHRQPPPPDWPDKVGDRKMNRLAILAIVVCSAIFVVTIVFFVGL